MNILEGRTPDDAAIRALEVIDNKWVRFHRTGKNGVTAETADEVPFSSTVMRRLEEARARIEELTESLASAEQSARGRQSDRAFRSGARVLANAKSLRTNLDKFIAMQAKK